MQNLTQVSHFRRAVDPAPELAAFDRESGLALRQLFRERIDRQWEQCGRGNQPLAVLLLSVDGVGDSDQVASHDGDIATFVREIGSVITDACRRRADFAGRMRTREIGIMLAESNKAGAAQVAQTILDGIRELPSMKTRKAGDRPTVAIGIAVQVPSSNRFASSLLICADHALQEARERGGDCICFYDD